MPARTVAQVIRVIQKHGEDWVMYAHPNDTFSTEMALIAIQNKYQYYIKSFRRDVLTELNQDESRLVEHAMATQTAFPAKEARSRTAHKPN